MKIAVFVALSVLLLIFLLLWLLRHIRYSITPRHLKISLFGLSLRRIPLTQIESISKRRAEGWAENWWNTTKPGHRALVIRKRRGLIKNLVITPRNRYIFKADLQRAIDAVQEKTETTSS
jgi:hypothetical protein